MLARPVAQPESTTEALLQLGTDQGCVIDLLEAKPDTRNTPTRLEQLRGIIEVNQCNPRIVLVHIQFEDRADFKAAHSWQQSCCSDLSFRGNEGDPVSHPDAQGSRQV